VQHTNTSSMSSGSTTCLFYRDLRARQLTTRSLHDISNRFEGARKAFRDHLWFTLTRTKSDENARTRECCGNLNAVQARTGASGRPFFFIDVARTDSRQGAS
jgi:hypothetical protein